MSKCREAFIKYQGHTPECLPWEWIDWICAWNAATENAAKVCNFKAMFKGSDCAEAIRKEKS